MPIDEEIRELAHTLYVEHFRKADGTTNWAEVESMLKPQLLRLGLRKRETHKGQEIGGYGRNILPRRKKA